MTSFKMIIKEQILNCKLELIVDEIIGKIKFHEVIIDITKKQR